MSQRVLTEVVSQYFDAGSHLAADYLSVLGLRRAEAEPLFGIVRLLRSVLVPVEPSPEFAAELKARLMTMPAATISPAPYASRVVIGAVAVGSVVSAAAAYWLYSRSRLGRAA
jgi:hypothetical protein